MQNDVDPFLFEKGGTIDGTYSFSREQHVELTKETSHLRTQSDLDNFLKFTDDGIEINKALIVNGVISAPNMPDNANLYPANASFLTVAVTDELTVPGNTVLDNMTVNGQTHFHADVVAVQLHSNALTAYNANVTNSLSASEITIHDVATVQGNLLVNKTVTTNDLHVNNSVEMDGDVDFFGDVDFSNANVTGLNNGDGDLTVNGNLCVEGTSEFKGVLTGNVAHTESLIVGNLLVATNDTSIFMNHVDFTGAHTVNFTGATVTGLPHNTANYPSIIETDSFVDIDKIVRLKAIYPYNVGGRIELGVSVGCEVDNTNLRQGSGAFSVRYTGYHSDGTVEGCGHRIGVNDQSTDGKVYIGRWDNKYPNDDDGNNPTAFGDVNLQGALRFSEVPTSNFNSGEIFARLDAINGLQAKIIQPVDTNPLTFLGDIDFTAATVTGLDNGGYPSISEHETFVQVDTNLHVTGRVDVDWVGNHHDLTFTKYDPADAHTWVGGFNVVTHSFDEDSNSSVSTFNALINNFSEINIDMTNRPNGLGLVIVNNDETIYNQTMFNVMYMNKDHFDIGVNQVWCEPTFVANSGVVAPKKGSGGNFTHCHLTESDDTLAVGKCVTSTGVYCARDDTGNLIGTPINAPDPDYAICKVRLAAAGDSALGVVSSVETVANELVDHAHGGLTIRCPVKEADGHTMVRVASAGDVLAYVRQPTLVECALPDCNGLWSKTVNGVAAGDVVAIESALAMSIDGYTGLLTDRTHSLGAGGTITLTETSMEIEWLQPRATDVTADLLSGTYTKTVNGMTQNVNIVVTVNPDFSFTMTENVQSFVDRVAALETAFAELTGPD